MRRRRLWSIGFEFKLEDFWIGVFWKSEIVNRVTLGAMEDHDGDVWICLLPCLPLHISWRAL